MSGNDSGNASPLEAAKEMLRRLCAEILEGPMTLPE